MISENTYMISDNIYCKYLYEFNSASVCLKYGGFSLKILKARCFIDIAYNP